MNKGAIVSIIVALTAFCGMVFAFLNSASPYVTVAEAQVAQGDDLHVAGDLLKESLETDLTHRQVKFKIKDEKGDILDVVYNGSPPANMGNATKVVAIGGMKEGKFVSDRMLIKCPSRYEEKSQK